MKIAYTDQRFHGATRKVIDQANVILAEYAAQGHVMTLRMLYYQFVARDLMGNTMASYKRLVKIMTDARLAGQVDWDHITDRTRWVEEAPVWNSTLDMMYAAARSYNIDRWADQPSYVEIWVEKDALKGVIAKAANRYDVPYFSCRGYTSLSEMREAAKRIIRKGRRRGKQSLLIHLGDHDPSGLDMTRDIEGRLNVFRCYPEIQRIALNMDQVIQYQPPPNPAKITDSRYAAYQAEYGEESWELDALEPGVLTDLITETVESVLDRAAWGESTLRLEDQREELTRAAEFWPHLRTYMSDYLGLHGNSPEPLEPPEPAEGQETW